MKPMSHLMVMVLAACGSGSTAPQEPLDPEALNILFVGNSLTYTNDLPGVVAALVDSAGLGPVTVTSEAFPNFGLEDHWAQGGALRHLRRTGWDYVVMQQGPSATEGRPSLLEYAERFATPIRSAGAVPALLMVWPSSAREFDWDGVRDSYRMAAERADGIFLPAGEAWREAWARDASLLLYGIDGFHPSPLGTYLAALVVVERLTGRSAIGLARELRTREGTRISVPAATALLLQEAAHEVVTRYAATLGPP
ncbi:MAG TPA: hypothetical protein VF862_12145 [Gemmatimonadales bacterium]